MCVSVFFVKQKQAYEVRISDWSSDVCSSDLALANPQAGAICFSGDGSLLMSVQELATLAELQANVKIIVLDNGALGMGSEESRVGKACVSTCRSRWSP